MKRDESNRDKVFVYQGGLGYLGRLLIWLVGGMWLIATPLVLFSGMKGLSTGKIIWHRRYAQEVV